ncbi:MAG: N-acetylmuramoyl-L-alanine amidase, partial [Candidatus Omnitrophica bacterium]|nr:N-acetylmuramoyl-L-alanine amidase [Candidatus Omnitrophota bacterium]
GAPAKAIPAKESLVSLGIKKIVIDPGHGGSDPGAIGRSGTKEKDLNLDMAKRLASLLRQEGAEVIMTRTDDTFIPLARRVEIAHDSKADLFVSLHCNANRVRSLSGIEIYHASEKADDSKRALTAARELALDLDSSYFYRASTDVKAIVWDMIYNHSRAESIGLGGYLKKSFRSMLSSKPMRLKGANFVVLKGAHVPAVLVEAGFLSNAKEEKLLKNGYYRQSITEAIVKGIKDYAGACKTTEVAKR